MPVIALQAVVEERERRCSASGSIARSAGG
jgi:hypothetical protein